MKALSILQPWAWAIAAGFKDIENRSWRHGNPGLHFRGPVLIHAGKGWDENGLIHIQREHPEVYRQMPPAAEIHRGGIVGRVTVVDVVRHHSSRWFFGPVGLVLADARPLPFRPLRGQLGFFVVPDGADAPIADKVAHVMAAPHTAGHTCHWPGCTTEVRPAVWGCKRHWRALPAPLQRLIWATYRPGQEQDKRPSADYIAAARQVQDWIAQHLARKPEQGTLL